MRLFRLLPEIHKFNCFKEFSKEFNINKNDLVISSKSIYNRYIKPLNLDLKVIFPKDYGSGEPTNKVIDKVIEESRKYTYTRIIAIGGGAILDIGKLLVLENVKNSIDIFEKTMTFTKEKELIMIPTTCGTGSEVTNFSVAEIIEKGTKMGVGIDEIFADAAILIPELFENLPYNYFAFSSIDALVHAVESFLSPNSNIYTETFAKEAIRLIIKGYINILKTGKENLKESYEDFIIGSNFAGIAFGNTGVAAVHALSYPLGGKYHVPHGESNYQFFIPILKTYMKKNPEGKIKDFSKLICDIFNCSCDTSLDKLEDLLEKIWHKKALKEYGMIESEIIEFTNSVIEKQQRLLSNNYTEISNEDILKIYTEEF